ncbi:MULTISPECIES: cation:proton antiporter [unclassified Arenibacter]|uniref:cation:proton antiporter n=1 Tax=unclassified Arenibacter TaxID=2615047 RepID=UPI000E345F3B|nr:MULTISPECIES: cation:proton antiporter [unclassified Arenibacter]MCM4165369.1 sodium:proton antiporter [Arenibacter sp. A80]RFT54846.1 cation:proton antiporter [Arenibacter sp. P308M17]
MSLIVNVLLPLEDPVLKFLIILLVILVIPIISDKLKLPHLLGMILAGIVIGPHGLNLLARDSSIILSGTAGLLYIMFLAGLEIDMNDFKTNVLKSTLLGLYGFLIPMLFGTLTGVYILGFSPMTSVLLASMFASHTLITYPIVSKLGIAKNLAVNISVGSTLITNVLSLLVLAVVVGMNTGELNQYFWIIMAVSFVAFTLVITYLFPIIGRWFFKRYSDNVSQYIFVLVMVFLGAVLSQLAGIEAIIGAFMAGLALNRLIPLTSPLMNRIDFVGNAIFIPFFLIGVGMLIDYRAFSNLETVFVAITMSVVATISKFTAAWISQKNFKFTAQERLLIFGLTNAQAAATLAAVLVGYNIVLGETANGEPIRLLNDSVLNGTIIMILVTCTIASFATQKGAKKIALSGQSENDTGISGEKILIPLSNPDTIDELVNLSIVIKSKQNVDGLQALNIINNDNSPVDAEKKARKLLEKAKVLAAAVDLQMKTTLRYDLDLVHGVTNVIKEENSTDLILGLHLKRGVADSFLGNLTSGILEKSNITTFIYNPQQPISTIKRHFVIVPENAEYESGFSFWLSKIWNIALNTGAKLIFYAGKQTIKLIGDIHLKHPIELEFRVFENWEELPALSDQVRQDDNLVIVLSRKNLLSYQAGMADIPSYLNRHYQGRNFLLVYPSQSTFMTDGKVDLTNPSLLKAIEKLDVIGKTMAGIFRKK